MAGGALLLLQDLAGSKGRSREPSIRALQAGTAGSMQIGDPTRRTLRFPKTHYCGVSVKGVAPPMHTRSLPASIGGSQTLPCPSSVPMRSPCPWSRSIPGPPASLSHCLACGPGAACQKSKATHPDPPSQAKAGTHTMVRNSRREAQPSWTHWDSGPALPLSAAQGRQEMILRWLQGGRTSTSCLWRSRSCWRAGCS